MAELSSATKNNSPDRFDRDMLTSSGAKEMFSRMEDLWGHDSHPLHPVKVFRETRMEGGKVSSRNCSTIILSMS